MKFLTIKEVCEKLKIGRGTLHNLRKTGLPVIKVGRSVRFSEEAIEKWLTGDRGGK